MAVEAAARVQLEGKERELESEVLEQLRQEQRGGARSRVESGATVLALNASLQGLEEHAGEGLHVNTDAAQRPETGGSGGGICSGGAPQPHARDIGQKEGSHEPPIQGVEVGSTGLPVKPPPRGMQGVEAKAAKPAVKPCPVGFQQDPPFNPALDNKAPLPSKISWSTWKIQTNSPGQTKRRQPQ